MRGLAADGTTSACPGGFFPDNCDSLFGMADPLPLSEVRHVAKLARLRLSEEQLQEYRTQLTTVLDHIDRLGKLALEDVPVMAHPAQLTSRLGADEVEAPLPAEALLARAPAAQDAFIAVPKVLAEPGGA